MNGVGPAFVKGVCWDVRNLNTLTFSNRDASEQWGRPSLAGPTRGALSVAGCVEVVMAKASVLVVEDNPLSRATAVSLFEALGFTVFDSYNGHHALALLDRRPEISLLFVDVRMPGMSGPELARVVQERRPDIKIVLTSGYVGEEAVPSGLAFVPKPWRVEQVAKAIEARQV